MISSALITDMEENSNSLVFSTLPSAAGGGGGGDDDYFSAPDTNASGFLLTPAPEVVSVALWSVITHFLLLIAVVCLGIPANAVVLVAARWPIRSRHVWRRLVIGNLCVAQLFVCVVVSPVGLATTIVGYQQRPLPAGLCTVTPAIVHAALAASVVGFCLLAALRWHDLSLACAGEPQADEASGQSLMATACLVAAPWAAAAMAAALSAVEVPASVAFAVCRNLPGSQETTGATWRMKNTLMIVYIFATAVCVVILGAAYRCNSDRLDRLFAGRSEQTILLGGNVAAADDSNRTSAQNRKRRSSRGQDAGQSGKRSNDGGKQRPTNLTVLDGRPNEAVEEDEEENEGGEGGPVEDTFDTKMRLKFQKKAKSSGRRHTVANICLPDLGNHRRRSLENGKGKATSPANDYQYVRKWSVDITALANQLENPKIHTGSYPTLRNSSPSSGNLDPSYRVGGGPGRCVTPEVDSTQTSSKELALPGGAPSPSSPLPPLAARLVENKKQNSEMYITLETPSIVVSLTPDTEAGDDDDNHTMADSFVSQSRLESDGATSPVAPAASKKASILAADDKGLLAAREELSEVMRTAVAILVSLLLILPLAVFTQAEHAVGTSHGPSAAFNLDLVCVAVCLLQAATIPGLQVWANRELKDQLSMIVALLRNLRCVCYCNLGSGRSCLVRKRRREQRQQKV